MCPAKAKGALRKSEDFPWIFRHPGIWDDVVAGVHMIDEWRDALDECTNKPSVALVGVGGADLTFPWLRS